MMSIKSFFSRLWAKILGLTYHPKPMESLLFDKNYELLDFFDKKTGQGINKRRHYFEAYHRHFAKFNRRANVLEIGCGAGGSLEMWDQYFIGTVYGVDINPNAKKFETNNIKIMIGNQADRDFWRKVKQSMPDLDIIIEDGGHSTRQQLISFEEMFEHLRPGGVYICEDIDGMFRPTTSYFFSLVERLNDVQKSHWNDAVPANDIQRQIKSITFYPWLVVVEKQDGDVRELRCQQRGNFG